MEINTKGLKVGEDGPVGDVAIERHVLTISFIDDQDSLCPTRMKCSCGLIADETQTGVFTPPLDQTHDLLLSRAWDWYFEETEFTSLGDDEDDKGNKDLGFLL